MLRCEVYVADFETTVFDGQTRTDVWASAVVPLYSENVKILGCIEDTLKFFANLKKSIIVYYHNLKFDGSFWVTYLLSIGYKLAQNEDKSFIKNDYKMKAKTLKCSISDRGPWYTVTFSVDGRHIIELRDSMKLLPFSVKKIGKDFKTKHQKLTMEYKGFRFPNCPISDTEKQYIANDVLVVKEALEFMFSQGHDKLTIGSCCLGEFKSGFDKAEWEDLFPDVYQEKISVGLALPYGAETVGDYIHKAYRGGWCYVVPEKAGKVFGNGVTADVNSLYPSMMSSESGNYYPVGLPTFFPGSKIKEEWVRNRIDSEYWYIRFKCRFYIKDGYLPFIQIKNSYRFKGTECLKTSDYWDPVTEKYYRYYKVGKTKDDLQVADTAVELTMTQTDYILFREHYNVEDFEILDGCVFSTQLGIFDRYIEKYKKIKTSSTGAMRQLAKLFLNNLYGKMAASTDSSFKIPFLREDGSLALMNQKANDKKPGYIPIGAAITSYARNFTIRAAQKNYHGIDKPGFIYADTDSIHCDLAPEDVQGITVHPTNFCCWDLETNWNQAIFVRQKTYIEHVTHEHLAPIESPYYNIKCAGMPDKCKDFFRRGLEGETVTQEELISNAFTESEIEAINTPRTLTDFKVGLQVPGKLTPRHIPGGTLLCETPYTMHAR